MKRILMLLTVTTVAAVLIPVGQAAVARHSKRQAEVNLLRATKVITSWRVGLIDPSTKLLRSNTVATCAGRGPAEAGRYAKFSCALRNGKIKVAVTYFAQRDGGFELARR